VTDGTPMSEQDWERRWRPWSPAEVTQHLSTVTAPWYVAAGWALDLYTGGGARPHGDIEIGLPHECFDQAIAAFPDYAWDVAGDGLVSPWPLRADDAHQTWLRDPGSGYYVLDVFREPSADGRWVCRRDASITLPYDELILHTGDGIPFCIPEVALLFKAKHARAKDHADFHRVVPMLERPRQDRLAAWLRRVHPGHAWLAHLAS
jgi:hypothetical protein